MPTGRRHAIPREVIVPVLPEDAADLESLLGSVRGSRVRVHIAQRGDKRALAETVHRNAEQALALHKTRRASDLTARSRALQELQDQLGLAESPLRIECYDISHTGGTEQVASMVVFEDGLPRKGEYRHFVVRGEHGEGARDDTEAMHEVLTRRFRRYLIDAAGSPDDLDEQSSLGSSRSARRTIGVLADRVSETEVGEPRGRRPKRFAYPPNLVVVDGGQPQVAAAQRALADLGVVDVAIVGLAKRLEEVWLPGEEFPLVLPRTSEGLYLLQRVRDEAHRFAITHHRKRRAKSMTRSELETIPGLGPARQASLLRAFGSVRNLRAASAEEIAAVPGIGSKVAQAVVDALAAGS